MVRGSEKIALLFLFLEIANGFPYPEIQAQAVPAIFTNEGKYFEKLKLFCGLIENQTGNHQKWL